MGVFSCPKTQVNIIYIYMRTTMNNFISEIVNNNDLMLANEFRFTYCAKTLWVANYIKIITFTPEKIVLKIKGDLFMVEGEKLKISTMEKHSIIVNGNITLLYFGSSKPGKQV